MVSRLTPVLDLSSYRFVLCTIGSLGERSAITGSTLTHHVKLLVAADLVQQQKQGRNIICAAVAHQAVHDMSQFLLTECCADADAPCPDHPHP